VIAYYEKIMDLWRAGKTRDAVLDFYNFKKSGQLTDEEIEKLEKFLPCDEVFVEMFLESPPHIQLKIKKLLGI